MIDLSATPVTALEITMKPLYWKQLATAACLAFVARLALAQMMISATISGQALQYMKDGRVSGCGIRMVGIEGVRASGPMVVFDASFNTVLPGLGTVKGDSQLVTLAQMQAGQSGQMRPRPVAFWIRAPGSRATQPREGRMIGAITPPEAVMYVTDRLDDVMALFTAVASGKPIQVGIRQRGESVDRVFYGTVTLSDGDRGTVHQCFSDLAAGIERLERSK